MNNQVTGPAPLRFAHCQESTVSQPWIEMFVWPVMFQAIELSCWTRRFRKVIQARPALPRPAKPVRAVLPLINP